ncbi:PREDICTED: uncharacterized protein LOC109211947 [Nicotiana attenuata]|uniref:uncharacterized protein LOC109211947 n=1 Tax=Nicotiana attenuata TaxID=49451 RepID=UPI000904D897|nr:PREDICTED: uncharacterized protein LOC109211947 [Nicotiana attenuata]
MAKAIPKISSHRRIGSRKGARRIPKRVIHVQASFNNTIVTVTDVRVRVVSWSSAGTSGFKGTRRGTKSRSRKRYLYSSGSSYGTPSIETLSKNLNGPIVGERWKIHSFHLESRYKFLEHLVVFLPYVEKVRFSCSNFNGSIVSLYQKICKHNK